MPDMVAHGVTERAAALLGGRQVLRRTVADPMAAHDLLSDGLPAQALTYLLANLVSLRRSDSLGKAVGMSLRTFQRRRDAPVRLLSAEQSGRTWKFAEILAHATAVFGSQAAAERWLESPAMALARRRPIDLLATPAGVEMVETLLGQIEYGVYI